MWIKNAQHTILRAAAGDSVPTTTTRICRQTSSAGTSPIYNRRRLPDEVSAASLL